MTRSHFSMKNKLYTLTLEIDYISPSKADAVEYADKVDEKLKETKTGARVIKLNEREG